MGKDRCDENSPVTYATRLDYSHCFCSENMVSGVSVQVSGKVGAIAYLEH